MMPGRFFVGVHMAVSAKHLFQQGPVISALGKTALAALAQTMSRRKESIAPPFPGPIYTSEIPPLSADLVDDFLRWSGTDPNAYGPILPPQLFPHWSFPLISKTLKGVDYPLMRILNAGCRMEVHAPLPRDEPLHSTAQLISVDDDGRRAIIHQRLVTGTESARDALSVDFQAIVPLSRAPKTEGGKKEKPRVPNGARPLMVWELNTRAGLDFALLTGDFNPIHWIAPYARLSGFKNTILHGFATMTRAIEGMNHALWSGDCHRLKCIEVRFPRPLVLPAKVGLYVDDEGGVFVGDGPDGPAYMCGTFEAV
jgi:hypothetical protein